MDDRHREDLICFHFAQQYAKNHYGHQLEQPQFYVVGRDNPWDVEYVMHDGTTFFVEVCRIADEGLLRAIKSENDVSSLLLKPELAGFEIQKIERHFPGTLPRELVDQIRTKEDRQRKFVWNSDEGTPKVFWRPPMDPSLDLQKELKTALKKKASKKHAGKERTIILLDNLTTHSDPGEFFAAMEGISEFLQDLPFKEVWLYTGYYSDDNGYNCEYSLIPLKFGMPSEDI